MTMANWKMCSTAIAAILSLPLATGSALAQQSQDTGQTNESVSKSAQTSGSPQEDAVVAKVGDVDITGADVMAAVATLPPQLQSQPTQMLVPIALQQLVLRELILEQARSQNLSEDSEVTEMVETAMRDLEQNAMVEVWLAREMEDVVTDDAVQSAYEDAKSQSEQELPPLDAVRPQIEQNLRQQAMQDLSTQLQDGADVVFYDASGNPVDESAAGSDPSASSGSDASQSEDMSGDDSESGSETTTQ